MRQRRFAIVEAAGFAVALAGAVTTVPASAAPLLAPNGSFDYNTPGTNSVNTGNIAASTITLTLGRAFPGSEITSFVDPFLGAFQAFLQCERYISIGQITPTVTAERPLTAETVVEINHVRHAIAGSTDAWV